MHKRFLSPVLFFILSLALAAPAQAEISSRADRVQGSANLDVIRLDGGTLFGSDQDTLTARGKQALDQVIKDHPVLLMRRLQVTGHTDYMGGSEYNRALSKRRAEAVRRYLLSKNRNFQIVAEGLGETRPLVECDRRQPRAALIKCLAPNRRVEIETLYD